MVSAWEEDEEAEVESTGLTIFTQLALNGNPVATVQLNPTDTIARLRKTVAEKAGETGSLWLILSGRLLLDHETLEEARVVDRVIVDIVRCKPVPALAPPPAAPTNWRISVRCALTGDAVSALSLWPMETLAAMRQAVAQHLGGAGPVQLLAASGQLLVGPMTLVDAGLLDGAIVDVVRCGPRFVVTASADCTAGLWSAESGERLLTLEHQEWVNAAAVSQDGRFVVTALFDGIAKIWCLDDGACIQTLVGHAGPVLSSTFSKDGRAVATASFDRTAKLWSVESGHCVLTLSGHTDGVNTVALSPNGTLVATASSDRSAKLWSIETAECLRTFEAHGDEVKSVCFSPEGMYLVTASADHLAMIWNVESGECERMLSGSGNAVSSAVFSPHGRLIATAASDGTARIWDAETGDCKLVLSGHADVVTMACFSRDGELVVTSSSDGTARIWNIESGQCTATLAGHVDAVIELTWRHWDLR